MHSPQNHSFLSFLWGAKRVNGRDHPNLAPNSSSSDAVVFFFFLINSSSFLWTLRAPAKSDGFLGSGKFQQLYFFSATSVSRKFCGLNIFFFGFVREWDLYIILANLNTCKNLALKCPDFLDHFGWDVSFCLSYIDSSRGVWQCVAESAAVAWPRWPAGLHQCNAVSRPAFRHQGD